MIWPLGLGTYIIHTHFYNWLWMSMYYYVQHAGDHAGEQNNPQGFNSSFWFASFSGIWKMYEMKIYNSTISS